MDAVLAAAPAGAAAPALSCAPSAAPAAEPDSSSAEDEFSAAKYDRATKKFKSMYDSHHQDPADGDSSTYSA